MKCTIPEISWHNRDPVLSVDIQPRKPGDAFFRLASGGTDSHVLIWHMHVQQSGAVTLECAADLTRHQKAVNVVRFSPSAEFLASGDDESAIIVWKQKTETDVPDFPMPGDEQENKEHWLVVKVLRGHLEDVYDISWAPDSKHLMSGSVDNTAIVWDVIKGRSLCMLDDHKGFVQGVAWDPLNQYMATLCSDRSFRVFGVASRRVVSRIGKSNLPGSAQDSKPVHLFHDDTLKSFFRRLCFSPDGQLIIAPSGHVEPTLPGGKPTNSTLVFTRNSLTRPVLYFPSLSQYSVATRCCPLLFTLRKSADAPVFALSYRIVIAIATQNSVVFYDTQQALPFAIVANIHYTRLTDIAWSSDGRTLVASSTDGYCSVITFAEGELGDVYDWENEKVAKQNDEKNCKNITITEDTTVKTVLGLQEERTDNKCSKDLCVSAPCSAATPSTSITKTPKRIRPITLSSPKSKLLG